MSDENPKPPAPPAPPAKQKKAPAKVLETPVERRKRLLGDAAKPEYESHESRQARKAARAK
jgi:hypothetical protein